MSAKRWPFGLDFNMVMCNVWKWIFDEFDSTNQMQTCIKIAIIDSDSSLSPVPSYYLQKCWFIIWIFTLSQSSNLHTLTMCLVITRSIQPHWCCWPCYSETWPYFVTSIQLLVNTIQSSPVITIYNIQHNMIFHMMQQWLRQDMYQRLYSRTTSHISPSRSFVRIWVRIDRVLTALHCIFFLSNHYFQINIKHIYIDERCHRSFR